MNPIAWLRDKISTVIGELYLSLLSILTRFDSIYSASSENVETVEFTECEDCGDRKDMCGCWYTPQEHDK